MLTPPKKPSTPLIAPILLLEGAAMLVKMAANIETLATKSKGTTISLPKSSADDIAKMLRLAGQMVNNLVLNIEHGDRFDEKPPPFPEI